MVIICNPLPICLKISAVSPSQTASVWRHVATCAISLQPIVCRSSLELIGNGKNIALQSTGNHQLSLQGGSHPIFIPVWLSHTKTLLIKRLKPNWHKMGSSHQCSKAKSLKTLKKKVSFQTLELAPLLMFSPICGTEVKERRSAWLTRRRVRKGGREQGQLPEHNYCV